MVWWMFSREGAIAVETQSGQFLTPGAPENTKGTLGINIGLVFGVGNQRACGPVHACDLTELLG